MFTAIMSTMISRKEGKKIIKRVRNLVMRDIKNSESSKSKCQLTSQVVT